MNNPSRIHPLTNQQQIQQGAGAVGSPAQIRNETPKITNKADIGNNINAGAGNMNAAGGNVQPGRRDEVMIDTNTNQNNMGNTNMQLSPTSNKSYLKISGYNTIEMQKKNFLQATEDIQNTRLVEILGGLATIEEKRQAILQFSSGWKNLLDILNNIQENINLMTFESDIHYPSKDQFISDLIIESVKEIESQYLDLIQNSSLRFLDTVCTVHDLQYKHLINIRYDIRTWRKNNIDHIKETQPTNRKLNSLSTNYDKDGNYNQTKNKSFFATICGCCLSSDVKERNNNRQQSNQIKR